MPPSRSVRPPRLPLILLGLFLVWWTILAIAPWYREDWLLENLLVFAAVPLLVWSWRHLPFSNGAYLCLFAFFCLHELGAHYTYAAVPYDAWWRQITGVSLDALLGFRRNQYDRLVHFLYGLLAMPAVVELLAARAPARGLWRWLVPLFFVMGHSVLFELVEWWAAVVFGGPLGQAYLGTQGDEWDAQKDMALASLGGALALIVLGARGRLRPPAPLPPA